MLRAALEAAPCRRLRGAPWELREPPSRPGALWSPLRQTGGLPFQPRPLAPRGAGCCLGCRVQPVLVAVPVLVLSARTLGGAPRGLSLCQGVPSRPRRQRPAHGICPCVRAACVHLPCGSLRRPHREALWGGDRCPRVKMTKLQSSALETRARGQMTRHSPSRARARPSGAVRTACPAQGCSPHALTRGLSLLAAPPRAAPGPSRRSPRSPGLPQPRLTGAQERGSGRCSLSTATVTKSSIPAAPPAAVAPVAQRQPGCPPAPSLTPHVTAALEDKQGLPLPTAVPAVTHPSACETRGPRGAPVKNVEEPLGSGCCLRRLRLGSVGGSLLGGC